MANKGISIVSIVVVIVVIVIGIISIVRADTVGVGLVVPTSTISTVAHDNCQVSVPGLTDAYVYEDVVYSASVVEELVDMRTDVNVQGSVLAVLESADLV